MLSQKVVLTKISALERRFRKIRSKGCTIKILLPVFLVSTLAFPAKALCQTVGDFQTHQTGNWSDVNSWERWDGSTWVNPAPNFPTSSRFDASLCWKTASEVQNAGFDIERMALSNQQSSNVLAAESNNWNKIGFISGAGSSNTPHEYSFEDKNIPSGKYSYRVKQIDRNGAFRYSQAVDVEVGAAPKEFTLSENYPNPFNPTTNIEFTVRENGRATLKIYNIVGQVAAELFDWEAEAGRIYLEKFDASRFASGIYFSVLQMGSQRLVHKMSLVK